MSWRLKITLFLILALAFVLRFFQLGQNPPSLDWDEVSIGYNAYSILRTGRDEYGNFLPLSIRSLEDYKPPIYTYLTVIPVAFLGLNEFAVRFPSAFFGFLTVVVVFFLTRELFKDRLPLAFLATFLLAISPWHLQFSRVAFEANLGLFLVILAVFLFLKGLASPRFLPFSAISFALSIYSYHSQRIFAPLLVLVLVVLYRRALFKFKKEILISIVVFFLLLLPMFPQVFGQGGLARFTASSPFTKVNFLETSIAEIQRDEELGNPLGRLLHNRRLVYFKSILLGYTSHFDLNFLTAGDGNPRHYVPQVGLVYLWEIPFLILGTYLLIAKRETSAPFIVAWMILAPLAASPVVPTPHAVRSLVFLPAIQIASAYGLIRVSQIMQGWHSRLLLLGVAAVAFLFFLFYLHQYYTHYRQDFTSVWQYGHKEAALLTQTLENQVDRIYVSPKVDEAYIFFLFHQKIDPAYYHAQGSNRRSFGKYYFLSPIEGFNFELSNSLFLGPIDTPQGIPAGLVKYKILGQKGEPLLAIAETQ